jgi:hypothetical protein
MSDQILGYNGSPSAFWEPGVNWNQAGQPITAPSDGTIHRLGFWLGRDYYLAPARLALWDQATGALLAYSDQFGVTQYSPPLRYEMEITPVQVSAGQVLLVGVWWPSDGEHQARYGWASGGSWAAKSVSGITGISGDSAQSGHVSGFAYLTPAAPPPPPPPPPSGGGVKVRRNGVWVAANVHVRRNGVWVDANVKVRRNGVWVLTE